MSWISVIAEILNQRHVKLDQPVPAHQISSRISVRVERRQDECVGLIRQQRLAGRIRRSEVPAAQATAAAPAAQSSPDAGSTPVFARSTLMLTL